MILAFIFFQLFFVSSTNLSVSSIESLINSTNSITKAQPKPLPLSSDSLQVNSLSLVAFIDDKQPGDSLDYNNISVGQKVWAYSSVNNLTKVEQEILFNWIKDDELYLSFPVKIGVSSNWRTYSYITAREGEWELQLVEIGTKKLLKKLIFTVNK